jgi:hypothetical protein
MPLLSAQANLLTLPSLQRGVVEVLITRGARALMERLNFKSFEGSSYDFNAEVSLPTGHSSRDPYGTTIPDGNGTRQRISVESAMLIRNADTAKIDVVGKSDLNNQRAGDLIMASKKLAEDFTYMFVNGVHIDAATDFNLKGLEYWIDFYNGSFTEQEVYGTDTGAATGTKQNLSLRMVDDLLSRNKGYEFDTIYSDRATMVSFMNLYNLAGGNTGAIFMDPMFGKSAISFMYRGKPWYILDAAGAAKVSSGNGAITNGDATLVVDMTSATGDPHFPGFTNLDIGRTISVPGAGAAAATLTTTIASINAVNSVELAATASTTVSDASVTVAATNVIYAVRHDEEDGVCAVYHQNRGVPADAGRYFGPIAGFDAEDLGLLEAAPRYRTRLDWYGNFVVGSPFSVARLSHFIA